MEREEFKKKYFTDNFYWLQLCDFQELQRIAIEMGLTWHTGDIDIMQESPHNNLVMFKGEYFQSAGFFITDAKYGEAVVWKDMIADYHCITPHQLGE
jgi:hypothetical protein